MITQEISWTLLLSPYLVEDVCGLIRKPNGRVEAGSGCHDDNVMSYLIGMFVYLFAPYEKLEEYGIKRGATDNISDYDEEGNITEEGTMRKLLEMYPSLPESMQTLIKEAAMKTDPVKESEDYYRQVRATQDVFRQEMSTDNGMTPGPTIIPSQLSTDEAFWQQYDEGVWNSNDYDFMNPNNKKFDINDYIDD